MNRDVYDEDHEAFRASVREFLERSVIPHVEQHAQNHAIPREVWLEAGKQGFLGLEIYEQHGRLRGVALSRHPPASSAVQSHPEAGRRTPAASAHCPRGTNARS